MFAFEAGVASTSARWERAALASGAAFAVGQLAATAYFVAALVPHLPPLEAPVSQHGAFYAANHSTILFSNYLFLAPTPLFLFFLAGLFSVLRRLEGGVLTVAAIGAGLSMAMLWPSSIVVTSAGQGMAKDGLDPAAVLAFDAVAQLTLALGGFPRSVLLAGTSLVLLETRVGPRWLGWGGIVLALLALASTATLVNASAFPLVAAGSLTFALWLVALSAVLVRHAGERR